MKKNFLLTALTITLLANTNKAFSEDVTDYDTLQKALTDATQTDINITGNITVDSSAESIEISSSHTINANKHNLDGSNYNYEKNSYFINMKSGKLELKDFGDNNKESAESGIINFKHSNSIFYAAKGSELLVENSKFAKNETQHSFINVANGAKAHIENAIFLDNKSSFDSAGIMINGEADITNSYFKGNTATSIWGNAAAIAVNGTAHIKNSEFIDNKCDNDAAGGAIDLYTGASLYLSDSKFIGNECTDGSGGAINAGDPEKFYIENSLFENNKTTEEGYSGGGAISLGLQGDNEVVIYNSEFKNNETAMYGGAIDVEGFDGLYIVDSSFYNNTAKEAGGAILSLCVDSALNIISDNKDVLFSNNTSDGQPNDIYNALSDINLFASAGHKITFNGGIYSETDEDDEMCDLNINQDTATYKLGDGTEHNVKGAGEIQFNNDVQNLNVNLYAGKLSIGQNGASEGVDPDSFLDESNFNIKGDSILNTANGIIGKFAPKSFTVDSNVNWEYHFDIDLAAEESDKLVNLKDNKGNLKLGLLNIIKDTNKSKVEVKYSDTNINGELKEDYTVTTSKKTYKIEAKNDESGSSLVIKQDSSAYGLAGAVEEASDVYSNTSDSDEVVEHWLGEEEHDNKLQKDLVVNANDKGIVAGQENLDGLVTNNHNLDVNNAKDFSGFNVAVDNTGGGTVNLKDSNFTGNKGDAAVKNKDGDINIHASNRDVTFDNESDYEISSDGGNVNIDGGNSVTFEGDLQGSNDANLNLKAGNVNFNGEVSGFNATQESGNVNVEKLTDSDYTLKGGNLNVKKESDFNAEKFTLEGGNLNTSNGKTGDLTPENFNLNGNVNMSVDVDLANEQMDRLTSDNYEYTDGNINVNKFNIFSDTSKSSARVNFTDNEDLKSHVSTDVKNVYGPIYNYAVSYDPETGDFLFNGGGRNARGYNPAIMASPIAAQLGGYLTQLNSYDEAFRNMDMYMLMTKAQRNALKFKNKYAAADSNLVYDPIISKNESNTAWMRPYTTFENVPLKNGQKVSNVAYGSFFGAESPMYDLGHGWDGIYSVYAGYNGSHQAYDGVGIYQNGATLGLVGMAYKDNFFTGLTANVGSNIGEANTMYGNEDFTMLMSGVASKSGYNFEFKDGKFIVQPNFMLSYSFINTFDYTNAAGIRINADPLHAIQVEPGVKFIANLNNGWQPYLGVSFVYNILDKTNFMANDVTLPELSVKPFAKYGIGVRKSRGERLVGYLQTYFTNGGRNGIGIQTGFRFSLGK